MEPIQLTTREAVLYAVLANTVIGFLIGLAPLAIGLIKGRRKYAFFGLIACVAGGAVLGLLLSIPLAAVFIWIIFRSSNSSSNNAIPTNNDDGSVLP